MIEKLCHYIDASFPIIYLHTFEETKADRIIFDVAKKVGRGVVEWDASNGQTEWNVTRKDPLIKKRLFEGTRTIEETLSTEKEGDSLSQKILVLKDAHHFFDRPRIISMLKDIGHMILSGRVETTIFIVSPVLTIPSEIEKYTTVLEIGYLDHDELEGVISEFFKDYEMPSISRTLLNEMVMAFKGLTEYEIKNILALAYAHDGGFEKEDLKFIHDQKQQVIKKSGILEMIDLKESLEDIGGLENLKKWLKRKAAIFNDLNRAIEFGVDMPKGVLIAGVPGCGKSLNAKAAAKLFNVPLLRLDMGRLLGKYVGESEANMRKAISLAEAVSPCVLWIDEVEKAFAGIGGGGGAEVTTRLFGNFLTWMQEKTSPTFVVATANDILKLPPELMRKGRFDEIFYVGLPNDAERKKIFEIHIGKRRKRDLSSINLNELVLKTQGFSGADIEGVVRDSIEAVFAEEKKRLTTNDILNAIKNTNSLSEIMKDSIDKMSKEYERRKFKNASLI
ncbi:AAA family ATPase [Bacillus sp. FJAT-29814]|uniref:AAA family ATPase n=1 Tax=Bacillus sp. FJAT-29814 TaxID=1729688 RepID=UPI00082F3EA9|nr:AAA family ATPase [Bacillus sp. FJAT-29814]